MKYLRYNFFLSPPHVEKMKRIAESKGIKFSELLRKVIAEYVESQEEKSNKE